MPTLIPETDKVVLRRLIRQACIHFDHRFTQQEEMDHLMRKTLVARYQASMWGLTADQPVLIEEPRTWWDMFIIGAPRWLKWALPEPQMRQRELDLTIILPKLQMNIPSRMAGEHVVVMVENQHRVYRVGD